MGSRRNGRIAKNQSLFRTINDAAMRWPDRREALPDETFPVYCDCADPSCYGRMRMTRSEYEAIRAEPTRFALLPGHVFWEAERVVEERDGYLVVEKNEDVRGIVVESDPRRVVNA